MSCRCSWECGADDEPLFLVARAGEEPGGGGEEEEEEGDPDAPGPRSGVVDVEGRVVLHARPSAEWPQLFAEVIRRAISSV